MNSTIILGLVDKIRGAADKMKKFLSATTLDIIKTICVVVALCIVAYDYYNTSQKEHLDPTTRFIISGKIREDLTDLREFSGAGKTFILGYHNGVATFTRVPFVFADMRYEVAADSIEYTSDLFSNISLDKFSFVEQHIMDDEWCGPIASLNDHRLESVFKKHGVTYVHFSNIKDSKGLPVASVVLCWYGSEKPDALQHNNSVIKSYVRNIKTQILCYQ